jgi:hypothetical protein
LTKLNLALSSLATISVIAIALSVSAIGQAQESPSPDDVLTQDDLADMDSLFEAREGPQTFQPVTPDPVQDTFSDTPDTAFTDDDVFLEDEAQERDTGLVPLFAPGYEGGDVLQSEDDSNEETDEDSELLTKPAVLLRGLDKITGRSTDIEVATDGQVLFGGLRVTVRACHQTPPTEPPESIAYIEVEDYGFHVEEGDIESEEVDQNKRVFHGWMYASSPGINALEHPIYDIWVIRCMAQAPVRSDDESES